MYTLVKPEGFTIPAEATAIHGITTERALRDGYSLISILDTIEAEISRRFPRILVGHNVEFDVAFVLREFARVRRSGPFTEMKTFCTMKETTEVCRLPGKYGDYKWPKLTELHLHLFGKPLNGAHNAQTDVEACAKCFFELLRLGMALDWDS